MGVDPNGVTYTVKELLDRMDSKLDRIVDDLEKKADRDRVHQQDTRLSALELRTALTSEVVADVRKTQADVVDLQAWRNRLVGAFGLLLFLGGAAFLQQIGLLG